MRRNWQWLWSEPDGGTGVSQVSARTVEQAYEVVLEMHPGARVSATDAERLDPKWMPSLMVDWLRAGKTTSPPDRLRIKMKT